MKTKAICLFAIITALSLMVSNASTLIVEAFASTTPMTEIGVRDGIYSNVVSTTQPYNGYYSIRITDSSGLNFELNISTYIREFSWMPIGLVENLYASYDSESPRYSAWDINNQKLGRGNGYVFSTSAHCFTVTNLLDGIDGGHLGDSAMVSFTFAGSNSIGEHLSGSDSSTILIIPEPSTFLFSTVALVLVLSLRRR